MLNILISIVEKGIFRSVSLFENCKKRRTVVEVLFSFYEILAERILKEMKNTMRALMYDRRSDTGTHHVSMYMSHNASGLQVVKGIQKTFHFLAANY